LPLWIYKQAKAMRSSGIPTVGCGPKNHSGCYFCMVDMSG